MGGITAIRDGERIPKYGALADNQLDALARELVTKGYVVKIGAPTRAYSADEEWVEYAVVPIAATPRGDIVLPPLPVNARNYAEVLANVAEMPNAAAVPFLMDAARGQGGMPPRGLH
jgi:hypothetical protein